MNTGIIASRYAKALLDFSMKNGDVRETALQAQTIENALGAVPALRRAVSAPDSLSSDGKCSLILSSLGDVKATDSLIRFLKLIVKNGRAEYLQLTLRIFVDMWYKSRKVVRATLEIPVKSPSLEEKLAQTVFSHTGMSAEITTILNPDLIGGFVFTLEGERIDASVASQLETLRKQFIDKNRRIL